MRLLFLNATGGAKEAELAEPFSVLMVRPRRAAEIYELNKCPDSQIGIVFGEGRAPRLFNFAPIYHFQKQPLARQLEAEELN